MIIFKSEKLDSCLEEVKPLLKEHYREIHAYPDKIPFNPDYDSYHKLESIGALHITTARDNNKLIGYCVAIILPNLHYRDHLYANNDVIYLDPEYRGGDTGYKMMRYAEQAYKNLGASVMMMHMKTYLPFVRLCEAMGMQHLEQLYSKYIGD